MAKAILKKEDVGRLMIAIIINTSVASIKTDIKVNKTEQSTEINSCNIYSQLIFCFVLFF